MFKFTGAEFHCYRNKTSLQHTVSLILTEKKKVRNDFVKSGYASENINTTRKTIVQLFHKNFKGNEDLIKDVK